MNTGARRHEDHLIEEEVSMSDLLVERNGKLVGKGLQSLAAIVSLPEGSTGHDTEEMALDLLDILREERVESHPEGPLSALQQEIAQAAARRTEAQSRVQELIEIRELRRSAEAELQEATANLGEAIQPLKEMVAQGEGLLSYGVQQEKIYAVKLQIEEMEEEHQATCAPLRERLTQLSQRIEEIESLPHVQAYLKEKEDKEAMAKQKAQAEAKRKRLRTLLTKAEEDMKAGKRESAAEVLSQVLSEADPTSDEANQARQLDTILAQKFQAVKRRETAIADREARKAFSIWLRREVKPNLEQGDLVVTLALGQALHFRPAGETNEPTRISATVISSEGVDLEPGTSLYLTRLANDPKPVYRISPPGGGKNLIAREWVWEGDPEKLKTSHTGPTERQPAELQVHETQPVYPVDPIVVCTLAHADGDLQETLFGRYWGYAISEALRQVGYPVADDHPLIPEDGRAYLWGTYSDGDVTSLELFTEAVPHGLTIESRIRRTEPDIRLRARTTHVQKQLRSQASNLFPAQDH